MKRYFTILVALLLTSTLFAQQSSLQLIEPCGFDPLFDFQLKNEPGFKDHVESMEAQMYEVINRAKKDHKAGTILTIPIVFHVIHLGEAVGTGTNISDAQVESAVRGLNVFYRNNVNWGTTNPVVAFSPNSVDLEIEFCLAQRDPNGQPTNGITRVDGNKFANYGAQGIISTNEPAIIADQGWDKNKYYNVFVVAEINDQGGNGSGNVGNANFPPNGTTPSAANDRTVVIWKSTGYCGPGDPCPFKNTSLAAPYDNGTMNHEVGHAFALYHTFGNNGSGSDLASQGGGTNQPIASCQNGNETNCATGGDRCCDTQRHLGNLGTCPSGKTNECIGAPYNILTAANCMNYTNCQPLLFSPDQRDRIKATFTTNAVRINLTNSDGCNSVFAYDIGFKSITEPSGFYCDFNVGGKALVKNYGGNTVTSFQVDILVDNAVVSTYTWTGSLAPNSETTITIPAIVSTSGTHTYKLNVVTNTINGSQSDGQASNNSLSSPYEVITNGSLVTVSFTDFEAGDKVVIKNNPAGTVVKTVATANAGTAYSESVCLPKGCYNFELTDVDFQPTNLNPPGVVPTFSVKDDRGFEIAKGIKKTATSGAEVGVPKTEITTNKCLPFNPGYIDADFKSDQLIIVQGTSVLFTDLTTLVPGGPANAPAANQWNWTFGDGGTGVTQNPIYQYNTPGVYTVRLIANNGVAPDTAIKINYIRVLPTPTGCDQYSNLLTGESPQSTTTVNGSAGNYPGPNVTSPVAYAEKFYAPSASNLKSVDIFTTSITGNPASEVTITVYGNSGGLPGSALGFVKVPYSAMTSGNYTTNITFPYQVIVNDIYYIGIEMSKDAGDTIILGGAPFRGANDFSNTAFVLYGGTWKPVTTAFTGSSASSLGVRTNLSALPVAKFTSDVTQICSGKTINYDATTSANATSYQWTFEGGTPATSTNSKPVITYTAEGVKNVTLVVKGGCNQTDTIVKTIIVNPPPTVTVEGVDEVCNGANGSAKAIGAGGSNDYTYSWTTNPVQTSATATNLTAGSYTVTMTDSKCGKVTKSVSISNLTKLPDFDVTTGPTTCGLQNGSAKANPVGGTGTYTYTWTKAGDASFLQTGRTAVNLGPGDYTVEVQDGSCNPNQKTVTVSASAGVSGGVTASASAVCQGETVTLTASGGTGYLWNDGFTNFAYQATVDIVPNSSKTYVCRITDASGCFVDISKTVNVTQSPDAYAAVSNNNVSYGEVATVDISKGEFTYYSSSGSLGNTYKWFFGDGDSSNVKNPFHMYQAPGVYKVYLFVSIDGCVTMDSAVVNVIGNGTGVATYNTTNISVFPNPASDQVRINNPDNIVITSISVFDLVGKQVILVDSKDVRGSIQLGNLSSGSYLIKIETEKGKLIQKLDIIR